MNQSSFTQPRKMIKATQWLIVLLFSVFLVTVASAAEPNYGSGITIDGNSADWDLTNDFFADMYEAGNPSKQLLSKSYLRYDCSTNTLNVMVLTESDVTADMSASDAWMKIYDISNSTQVDGNSGSFAWLPNGAGYEASFPLAEGNYSEVEIHLSVTWNGESGRTSSTGKGTGQSGPLLPLEINCPAEPATYSLGDTVWYDQDQDGFQDAGEPGVTGITVSLYDNAACTGSPVDTAVTNTSGFYQFSDLLAGDYCVEFSDIPSGWSISPANIGVDDTTDSDANSNGQITNISLSADDPTRDMGIYTTGSLGDEVICVTTGEGIPNITVSLFEDFDGNGQPDGSAIATAPTNADGLYEFTNLEVALAGDNNNTTAYIVQVDTNDSDLGTCNVLESVEEYNPELDSDNPDDPNNDFEFSEEPPQFGGLEVTKVVDWNGVRVRGRTFEICIQGPSYPNGDEAGACQDVNQDGGVLTWTDLDLGDYIVSETLPDSNWSAEITGSPVTVSDSPTATVTVTNTHTDAAGIYFTKEIAGEGDPNNPDQTFRIQYGNGDRSIGTQAYTPGSNPFGRNDLPAGSWKLEEGANFLPANWTLDDITCESRDGTSTFGTFTPGTNSIDVELAAGDRVDCTLTNSYTPPPGDLEVTKVVDWNGVRVRNRTFEICIQGPSYPNGDEQDACQDVSQNGGDLTWTDLATGVYTVTETVPDSNWSAEIDSSPVTVASNLTSTVTITNTHTDPAGLYVTKDVPDGKGDPNNPDQAFSGRYGNGDRNIGPAPDSWKDGRTFGKSDLPASTWRVRETDIPANWTLEDITCESRDGTSTFGSFTPGTNFIDVELAAGDRVDCTVTNSYEPPLGSITVIKSADPSDGTDFDFTLTKPDNSTVTATIDDDTLDNTHINNFAVDNLPAGNYDITEALPIGWSLDSVECIGNTTFTNITNGITISLAQGEHATCIFNNTKLSMITLRKEVSQGDPNNPNQTFTLDIFKDNAVVAGLSTFKDGDEAFANNLLPGDYTVREILIPDGWSVENISCTSTNGNSIFETFVAGETTLDVDLAAGDVVTCTFTNRYEPQDGSITIVKEVVEGSTTSEFDFEIDFGNSVNSFVLTDGDSQTFSDLASGDYVINETFPIGENDDWEALEAEDIVCESTGGSTFEYLPFASEADTFGVKVTLAEGDTVTCTFKNTEKPGTGSLQVTKVVDWNGVTPDESKTFEICIQGPSYPNGDEAGACQEADFDGETLTWSDLALGDYAVTETDPGDKWIVDIADSPATVTADETTAVTVTNTRKVKKISPVLECVAPIGDTGMYRAFFGYSNPNAVTVEIPVGQNNKFNRTPQDQGQPTSFAPGRTPFFPNAAFSVDFDGSNLVWTLNGKTATASDNPVQRCNFYVTPDKEWVGADAPDNILLGLISATSAAGDLTCDWDGTDLVCNAENLKVPVSIDDQDNFVGEYSVSEDGLPEGWNILSGTGDFTVPNDNCEGKFCSHTVVNEKEVLKLERLIPDCYDVERDQYRWRVRNGNDVAIDFTLTNPAGDVIFAEGTAAPNGDTVVYTDKDETTNPTILRVDGVEQPKGRKNPNVNPCAPTTGNITVIKVIDWGQDVDEAPDTMFDFTGDIGSFTLGDGDSYTMKLPAGSYDIAEVYKYNWGVQEISCDGGDAERITRGVNVELSAGDDITCTFTNTPRCVNPRADLSAVITWDENTAMAHVTNDSDALCVWEVGMASYEKYNEVIDEQDIFDWTDGNPVPPGETIKMTIDKPQCAVQVDVFIGEVLLSLDGNRYGDRLLAWQHLMQDGYCERPADKVDGYVSADGAGLDGVTVTLTNIQADGLTFETVTNMDGYYAFSDVPFGSYRIEISGDVLAGMNMAETTAMIEVSTDVQAVANFSAEQAAPTAVTLTATSASTGSTSTMMISIIAAMLMLATLALWRRPEEQATQK